MRLGGFQRAASLQRAHPAEHRTGSNEAAVISKATGTHSSRMCNKNVRIRQCLTINPGLTNLSARNVELVNYGVRTWEHYRRLLSCGFHTRGKPRGYQRKDGLWVVLTKFPLRCTKFSSAANGQVVSRSE